MRFTETRVEKHIRSKHPGCPDFAVTYLVAAVAAKEWTCLSLGAAVGITMQGVLRHRMTDYDQLLLAGIDRNEARRRVQPKINAMLAQWKLIDIATTKTPE